MGFWRAASSLMWDKIAASSTVLSSDTQSFSMTGAEATQCYIALPAVVGIVRIGFEMQDDTAAKLATVNIYTWVGGAYVAAGQATQTGPGWTAKTLDIEVYEPFTILKVTMVGAIGGNAEMKNIDIMGTITNVSSDSEAEAGQVILPP